MKTLLTLSLGLALIYLLVLGFYALMQRSLIYYPTTIEFEQARQQARALGGAPWLDDDGRWLGWRLETGRANASDLRSRAVVFHGNAGMALDRSYYADLLSGWGRSGAWDLHVFEYPGYGPRAGQPSEGEFTAAALDAVDQLLARSSDPLLIIGESIGSGVASAVVRERPDAVAALMLITPFDSMVNVARHHMPWLPVSALMRDRFDNLSALSRYRQPLVVITAGQDRIVPAQFALPLVDQHDGRVFHETLPEAGHNTLHFDARRAPWPAVDEFLAGARR